jgi:Ni/Fe-hydrogenase 1 B-type cytochrome subunit
MKRTRSSSTDVSWKDPVPGQVRVYVWEWPIRFSHWVIVITILILSITGYYMHSPYVLARGHTAYVMGTMRFVHLLAAYAFTLGVAVRIVWFFLGNRWSHINQYVPTTGKRWRDMLAVGKYYIFLAWSPVSYIGHNPLAGASYLVIYCLAVIEILTGFALFSTVAGSPVRKFFIGWLPRLIDIQYLRETHFLIMFVFWMFFIHHLYTAILVSVEEESGLMDSIFSGYKFIPKQHLDREMEDPGGPPELLRTIPPPVIPEAERDIHAHTPL